MSDPAIEAAQRACSAYDVDHPRRCLEAVAREALKPIRELHRKIHPVFSWSDGLRFDDPCPDCDGKAGVHPCGCWADDDMDYRYRCAACRDDKGHPSDWPCETAKLIYREDEL